MKLASLTTVVFFSLSSAAYAAQVAVLPVQGTNLQPGEIEAVGVMLANAYAVEAKVDVAGPVEVAGVRQTLDPAANVQALIAALGASEYVEATAVQLKSKLSLRAMLRSADGALVHTAEITAASLDDIEQAAERLARALVNRTTVAETRTITNVTKTEGKAPNRVFSEKVWGLKTGVVFAVAPGVEIEPMIPLAFDWRFEGESYFLEFGFGASFPVSVGDSEAKGFGGVWAEFGGSYYLLNSSISPYVGGGVQPRIWGFSDDGGIRFAAFGQSGVMFMRESSTRFYGEFRVTQNVIPFEFENGDEHFPTEFGLNFGIGW